MSPSIYIGCSIEDRTFDALSEVNKTFREVEDEANAVLATLDADMQQLSGDKIAASITLGSLPNNEVRWTAKEVGVDGNQISIEYAYQAPFYDIGTSAFVAVPPASIVSGTVITLKLAVDAAGDIDPAFNTTDTVAAWVANPDVDELVTAYITGLGSDLPEVIPAAFLSGGKGAPLKDAEEASDDIARQFGQKSYQDLMTSIDIPIVESAADAVAYLESLDDRYIIVNGKLLIVEGTNLQGIRVLYNLLDKDVEQLRRYLSSMSGQTHLAHLFLTENVPTTRYELVCGEPTPIVVFRETLRAFNQGLQPTASKYTDGDVSALNGYVFWIEEVQPTALNYQRLSNWGYDDILLDDILGGETPVVDDYVGDPQIPTVAVIDDPTILDVYQFTDAEVVELLDKEDVPGIRAPSADDPEDKSEAIGNLLRNNRALLPNGMRTKLKRPLVVPQAVDLSKTGNDEDLSKELATRGKACARQEKNMRTSKEEGIPGDLPDFVEEAAELGVNLVNQVGSALSPNIPNLDLPNMPSADLPNVAKQVEAAFGALSSVVNTASKMFDRMIGGLLNIVKDVVNKLQNLLSMADNLLNNDLAKCLLGTSTDATGVPDPPTLSGGGVGGGGGGGGGGGSGDAAGGSITIGGIPIPMSLLGDALKELSDTLDDTLTSAFETMMGLIEKPVCMVQSLLDDILGFDLGAELNPCKDGKDPNEDCPPEETQDIINQSAELSNVMDTLPQTELYPSEAETTEVTEDVTDFLGTVSKTAETTVNDISRGVQEVMSDITKSLNSKLDTVSELDKAVKELLGETAETAVSSDESTEEQEGCAPASIGALSDAVSEFI